MRKIALKTLAALIIAFAVLPLIRISADTRIRQVSGNIVDVVNRSIYPGTLLIEGDKIKDIVKEENKDFNTFIIPGLIDAHVHTESSMLVPSEFAGLAVVHGTVATVSDPHEIANVLGVPGVEYMLANAAKVPFKFYFGASPCVPATSFETSGARFDAAVIDSLLKRREIKYLSEVMDYPGVIRRDPEVMSKIAAAKKYRKPVDGHAPGLLGEDLKKYAAAGITTDHESYMYREGLQEAMIGMKVLIREGSAAKNFDALRNLIGKFPDSCMFCSDDKHPNDLVNGHINQIVKRALASGFDKMTVLRCATYNPVKHYGLDVGLLQKGDPADFVVIDNFGNFNILETYINGRLVAKEGRSLISRVPIPVLNNFSAQERTKSDFKIKDRGGRVNVIEAIDGQIITRKGEYLPKVIDGYAVSDPDRDILKITVVNRYNDAPPAVAFVKNFGLKRGAIASSFAHDSHNVVAVGVSDEDLVKAVNLVIRNRGGLALADGNREDLLPLPVAGLMSDQDGYLVADQYARLDAEAKALGSNLRAPYMTLSFMALLVVPEIKLSDKGLFDAVNFKLIDLWVGQDGQGNG
ncbi:MAG: adenine deaminase [Candidatus Omnitrophica bacterium]|nr:adenine deaminase [Candidatus Omnitrophota bacterium]